MPAGGRLLQGLVDRVFDRCRTQLRLGCAESLFVQIDQVLRHGTSIYVVDAVYTVAWFRIRPVTALKLNEKRCGRGLKVLWGVQTKVSTPRGQPQASSCPFRPCAQNVRC